MVVAVMGNTCSVPTSFLSMHLSIEVEQLFMLFAFKKSDEVPFH